MDSPYTSCIFSLIFFSGCFHVQYDTAMDLGYSLFFDQPNLELLKGGSYSQEVHMNPNPYQCNPSVHMQMSCINAASPKRRIATNGLVCDILILILCNFRCYVV